MPKSDNQKLKILYIWDYLKKNSHEDNPVKAAELIEMLQNHHDIKCDRKTVYSDINALKEFGVDIETIQGKNGGYYIASGNFELPELKLLIDAVQSSRFLTERKSRELIGKLCSLCNERDAKLARRDVYISGRVKTMNESIYYSVDAIQNAISHNNQISFRYFDWGLDMSRHYRDKSYEASPYGLCQDNENYYLLAVSPRHGITSYRVDRMSDIREQNTKREPCPELTGKALTEYAKKRFGMFAGDSTRVKLRFHNSLINVVVDRFGRDVMLIPDDDEHFVFVVDVAVSTQFLGWVMGLGPKAKILYPQSVVDSYQNLCRELLAQYD